LIFVMGRLFIDHEVLVSLSVGISLGALTAGAAFAATTGGNRAPRDAPYERLGVLLSLGTLLGFLAVQFPFAP